MALRGGLPDCTAGRERSGRVTTMWRLGRRATKVLQRPGTFALAVLKGFRANQGVLLAGAVAYYTLLSLVPLLILSLMALSHLFSEDQLLLTLRVP
jgi:membrane protein